MRPLRRSVSLSYATAAPVIMDCASVTRDTCACRGGQDDRSQPARTAREDDARRRRRDAPTRRGHTRCGRRRRTDAATRNAELVGHAPVAARVTARATTARRAARAGHRPAVGALRRVVAEAPHAAPIRCQAVDERARSLAAHERCISRVKKGARGQRRGGVGGRRCRATRLRLRLRLSRVGSVTAGGAGAEKHDGQKRS